MTSSDLHSWVRTRWMELLDTARAGGARGMNWTATGSGEVDHDGSPRFDPDEDGPIVESKGCHSEAEAVHIATFDPTLTIAMCEAALERLDRHWAHVAFCPGCDRPAPCPDFLSDALPFRTRPDYPEELKRDG